MGALLKSALMWLFTHREDVVREVRDAIDPEPKGTPWPYATTEHVRKQIDSATKGPHDPK